MSDDMPSIFDGLAGPKRTIDDTSHFPTVAWGACPGCSSDKVALTRSGAHLMWKDHLIHLWGGAKFSCAAGGKKLCEAPARESTLTPAPICSHTV